MDNDLKSYIESGLRERVVSMPRYGSGVVEVQDGKRYFLKTGRPGRAFATEAAGLAELGSVGEVNVPDAVLWGADFLLTTYIESGRPDGNFYGELGRMVARLHKRTGSAFGFREDNFIGATPQPNIPDGKEAADWAQFFFNKRIKYQFDLAAGKGYFGRSGSEIIRVLEKATYSLLEKVKEPPALLHGDLWGGNYLCSENGTPYLIDPAVYYGHRETDIAMTLLFGGFPDTFYKAYNAEYPLSEGWHGRVPLYQLYHILNHLNIFGGGYLGQAREVISGLTEGLRA